MTMEMIEDKIREIVALADSNGMTGFALMDAYLTNPKIPARGVLADMDRIFDNSPVIPLDVWLHMTPEVGDTANE